MDKNKLKLIDSSNHKRSEFADLIYDCGDEYVFIEDEIIVFDDEDGNEYNVTYDVYFEGKFIYDADGSDVDITYDDITIKTLLVNGEEVELTKDLSYELNSIVEKFI